MNELIMRRREMTKNILPYDELLQSLTIVNGQTPAIITDYYPNDNTRVVCSCKLTQTPSTSANKCLCGTFTLTNGTLYRRFDCQFRNNLNVETNAGDGAKNKTSVAYTVNTQINWEFGNGYILKNGTRISGTASGEFKSDYPLVLFSNCNNGVPSISSTPAGGFVGVIDGNIYIYEGSTLIRCYHPAKKNERVGIWESVTNQMLFSPYGEFSE